MKIRTNTKNSSKKSLEAGAQKTAQRKKEKKNECMQSFPRQSMLRGRYIIEAYGKHHHTNKICCLKKSMTSVNIHIVSFQKYAYDFFRAALVWCRVFKTLVAAKLTALLSFLVQCNFPHTFMLSARSPPPAKPRPRRK